MASSTGMYAEVFDQLFEQARGPITEGANRTEPPLVDGSPRWGVSVIYRPSGDVAARLTRVTSRALKVIGGSHWPSGAARSVHLTVRALEPHRIPLAPDDPAIACYKRAMHHAATRSKPATFAATGLTLAGGSVMCCIEPCDSAADDFADALARELGDDGFWEAGLTRNIWYANLIHFTEPVRDGAALVDWVAERRHLDLGTWTVTHVELARWVCRSGKVVPVVLARADLGDRGSFSRA